MDLHPYDNVERRFRHTDPTPGEGRAVVARVLRLPALEGLALYDLSFLSGGMGIFDRLAITLAADAALWPRVVTSRHGWTPEQAAADGQWAGDLIWLLTDEEEAVPLRPAAVRFINQHRREFQDECAADSRILFEYGSGVNDWAAVWGDDMRLNFLGFSEG